MINLDKLAHKARSRVRVPAANRQARRYWLASDELLEFPAYNGFRGVCHLLIYVAARKPTLCLAGNFDQPVGAFTTTRVEAVATKVADRLGGDEFRLIEWYPHSLGGAPYPEVTLDAVAASTVTHGQALTGDGQRWHTTTHHTTVVRFANPRFTALGEPQLAKLLGHQALHELHDMAAMNGEYTPELLFGATGRRLAEEIRAHNDAQTEAFIARITARDGDTGSCS